MRTRVAFTRRSLKAAPELLLPPIVRASSRCFVVAVLWTNALSDSADGAKGVADPAFGRRDSQTVMPLRIHCPANNGATGRCAASAGLLGYVCREGKRSELACKDTSKSQACKSLRPAPGASHRLRTCEQLRAVQSIGLGRCETYRTRASAPPSLQLGFHSRKQQSSSRDAARNNRSGPLQLSRARLHCLRRTAVKHHGLRRRSVHLVHPPPLNRV